jgi:predicted negative regulator of RcsB-dependent stress response
MAADHPESTSPLAEISHGPSAFEQFLDNNQKSLMALTVLLALAAAGLVVYRGIEKSRQHTAGALFNKAGDLASMQAVINEHADTHAARSANILLADLQWKEGQQDAAIATLRTFIDSNPDHPALATARASLGSKLMAQGKNADAATIYQEIADDPKSRYLAPYAMISLGDLAKVAGDTDRAETFYKRAKADFPESGFAGTAGERIASLKAKAPVEVEAPPPAPETPAPGSLIPGSAVPGSSAPGSLIPVTPPTAPPAASEATAPAVEPAQEPAPEPRIEGAPSSESSPAAPEP